MSVGVQNFEPLRKDRGAESIPINWDTNQLFGNDKQFDSLNVRFVGNWPFGLSYAVAYDSINQCVFLGSGTGVYVLDVSTPTNPIKLSEKLHDRFLPVRMFYSNNLLYMASSPDGQFNIWDVNNIFSPFKIGEINICPFNDIEIFGNYTYAVAVRNDSLFIIDISTPSNPQEISSYPLPQGKGVAVAGNYAYVGAGNRGLRIIDISNPSNPQEIGSYEDSATTNATDVVVSGNYAYVCAPMAVFGELWVMDISNPSNPQRIAVLNKNITKFKISGNYLYAFEASYFAIYDISNPVNPQLVGFLSSLLFNGSPWDMEISGNYAYIASNIGGLAIVDISNPSNPFVIGRYDNPDATEDIVIVGNYAYVANFRGGLRIIDISTPSDPMEIGFCYTPQAMGLAVSGNYAYVSNGFYPVSIIDISNPLNPTMVGQYQQPGYSWNAAVSGNYLYVACLFDSGGGRLEIVDVSTPSNPQTVSYYNIPYEIEDVAVAGNYAYIPAMDSGFYVIDISNPSNPVQIGHLQWNGTMLFLVLSDSFAYVVTQDTSLCVKVVNVANPSNPWIVGSFAAFPGVSARGIGIFQNYVYMDAAPCTLYVIDVSIPSNPQLAGFYRPVFPCWNYHIGTSGRYIYASNWGTGMQIYENLLVGVEEEKSKIKVQKPKLEIYPNPLVHCATVEYQLPLENKVLFRIYDISGKLVKEVSPGNVCSGKHKIDVDDLPSGVYFLQLEGDKKLNHKFIVIGTGK